MEKGRHAAGRENCRPRKSETTPTVTSVLESKRKKKEKELRRQRSYLSLDWLAAVLLLVLHIWRRRQRDNALTYSLRRGWKLATFVSILSPTNYNRLRHSFINHSGEEPLSLNLTLCSVIWQTSSTDAYKRNTSAGVPAFKMYLYIHNRQTEKRHWKSSKQSWRLGVRLMTLHLELLSLMHWRGCGCWWPWNSHAKLSYCVEVTIVGVGQLAACRTTPGPFRGRAMWWSVVVSYNVFFTFHVVLTLWLSL